MDQMSTDWSKASPEASKFVHDWMTSQHPVVHVEMPIVTPEQETDQYALMAKYKPQLEAAFQKAREQVTANVITFIETK